MNQRKRYACSALILLASSSLAVAADRKLDYKQMLQNEAFEAIAAQSGNANAPETAEQADWFGQTGLAESVERALPRHLRQRLGQFLTQKNSLKAQDLEYLGVQEIDLIRLHSWSLPSAHFKQRYVYLYLNDNGKTHIGLGHSPILD